MGGGLWGVICEIVWQNCLTFSLFYDEILLDNDEVTSNVVATKNREIAPYIGWSTWKRLLERMKTFIPPRLDRSYFNSLGFSGTQYSQAMRALSFLGLIDESKKPVEKLRQLVMGTAEAQKVILKGIIEEAYKPFFDGPGPQNATFGELESFLRSKGARGVVNKSVTFFLSAAKEAGIPLSPQLAGEFRHRPGRRLKGQPKGTTKQWKQSTEVSLEQTAEPFFIDGIEPKLISYVAELPEEKQDGWIRAYVKIRKALKQEEVQQR